MTKTKRTREATKAEIQKAYIYVVEYVHTGSSDETETCMPRSLAR